MANNPQSSSSQPFRPPVGGPMSQQNFGSPFPMQFRPMMTAQQGQTFIPGAPAQQMFPIGQGNASQPPQYSQPMQLLSRPGQPPNVAPQGQPMTMTYIQTSIPLTSTSSLTPQTGPPNNHASGLGGPGVPLPSYQFPPSSFGHPQHHVALQSQFQPSQIHSSVAPVAGQPWLSVGGQGGPLATPVQQAGQQASNASTMVASVSGGQTSSSDWQEHTQPDGKRYYFNKKTRQSSWEKPLELMTPIERADASTVWKEFTTDDGRKYYYNKETKQSKWQIPEELKAAREQAEKEAAQGLKAETTSAAGVENVSTSSEPTEAAVTPVSSISTSAVSGLASSPVQVTPVSAVTAPPLVLPGSPAMPTKHSAIAGVGGISSLAAIVPISPSAASQISGVPAAVVTTTTTPVNNLGNSSQEVSDSKDGASVLDLEEAKKGMAVAGKVNVTPVEEKSVEEEPWLYASKQEAKEAFKALLESANVESHWNWEQTMRVIITDKRYGALKTLGERKQAFNEYLGQRKKLEAEERRIRMKKAREEFTKMLEECEELTSNTRWSKAISMFEEDERFKALERPSDREDLFDNYMVDLQKREKEKAQEDLRRNRKEFRQYLEKCDYIKVNTQWRKVQDRLEDEEKGLRLDKFDRFEVFQEYIRDLEQEEEQQKKIQKEQLKRLDRKNRDEFRKMMEEDIDAGVINAMTRWRDYCLKVKDSALYKAVALNTSGSTPKELFEDVVEELEKQYHDDKIRVKDVMKAEKVTITTASKFDEFKAAILKSLDSPPISDINFELVYEELLERAKEKEEKEAKKRQRHADDFSDLLYSLKELTTASTWEDSKQLFENSSEYKAIGEESIAEEIFQQYILHLQEKAKEKERKREDDKAKKEKDRDGKEKRKDRKEKEKEKEREKEKGRERSKKDETDSDMDEMDSHSHKEEKKSNKDKERKHRKRHHSPADDAISDKEEKEESRKSRRHGGDRKKSRKPAHSPDSDSETKHKKHKKDHKDEDLEDEEREDGEIQ